MGKDNSGSSSEFLSELENMKPGKRDNKITYDDYAVFDSDEQHNERKYNESASNNTTDENKGNDKSGANDKPKYKSFKDIHGIGERNEIENNSIESLTISNVHDDSDDVIDEPGIDYSDIPSAIIATDDERKRFIGQMKAGTFDNDFESTGINQPIPMGFRLDIPINEQSQGKKSLINWSIEKYSPINPNDIAKDYYKGISGLATRQGIEDKQGYYEFTIDFDYEAKQYKQLFIYALIDVIPDINNHYWETTKKGYHYVIKTKINIAELIKNDSRVNKRAWSNQHWLTPYDDMNHPRIELLTKLCNRAGSKIFDFTDINNPKHIGYYKCNIPNDEFNIIDVNVIDDEERIILLINTCIGLTPQALTTGSRLTDMTTGASDPSDRPLCNRSQSMSSLDNDDNGKSFGMAMEQKFNDENDIVTIAIRHDYQQVGNGWLHPKSKNRDSNCNIRNDAMMHFSGDLSGRALNAFQMVTYYNHSDDYGQHLSSLHNDSNYDEVREQFKNDDYKSYDDVTQWDQDSIVKGSCDKMTNDANDGSGANTDKGNGINSNLAIDDGLAEQQVNMIKRFDEPINLNPLYDMLPKPLQEYIKLNTLINPRSDAGIVFMNNLCDASIFLGRNETYKNGNRCFFPASTMLGLADKGTAKTDIHSLAFNVMRNCLEERNIRIDASSRKHPLYSNPNYYKVRLFSKGTPKSNFSMSDYSYGYSFSIKEANSKSYTDDELLKPAAWEPHDEFTQDMSEYFDDNGGTNKTIITEALDGHRNVYNNIGGVRRGVICPCTTITGLGQPKVFDSVLGNMSDSQGIMARFIIINAGFTKFNVDGNDNEYNGRHKEVCDNLLNSISQISPIDNTPVNQLGFQKIDASSFDSIHDNRYDKEYHAYDVSKGGNDWIGDIYDEVFSDDMQEYCKAVGIYNEIVDYNGKIKMAALKLTCAIERYNAKSSNITNDDVYRELCRILILLHMKTITRMTVDVVLEKNMKIVHNSIARGSRTPSEISRNVTIKDKWGTRIKVNELNVIIDMLIANGDIARVDNKLVTSSITKRI